MLFIRLLKYFLSGAVVLLASADHARGQLPFSFQRNYLSEESFCVPLAENGNYDGDEILQTITRFGEEPLSAGDKNVFRVIDYGEADDVRKITIRKIEKADSVCTVTIKTIINPRRGTVFVHRKTYGLDKWDDFQILAKKYFREQDEFSSTKTYFPEGAYQRYELIQEGNYRMLSERQTGSNGMLLRDYLEYLLSPIYDEECPLTATTRGGDETRGK